MFKKYFYVILIFILLGSFTGYIFYHNYINRYLVDFGTSFIPDDITITDSLSIEDKIYYLENRSANIFISIFAETLNERYLYASGSLFQESILKKPLSICCDSEKKIFVLQKSNRIIFNDIFSRSDYSPSIKLIFSNGTIDEVSIIKEIGDLFPKKIRVCGKYLILSFENSNVIYLIDKESLVNKKLVEYKVLELPANVISIDTSKDLFCASLQNSSYIMYEYNSSNEELVMIKQIRISSSLINNNVFISKEKDLILFHNPTKKTSKIFSLRSGESIKKVIKRVCKIFKVRIDGKEEIMLIRSGRRYRDYIYIVDNK